MARKSRFIVLTIFTLLFTGSFLKLYCAVPKLIGFQGRLTNASGQAVTGSKEIIFKIYDLGTDGTVLWNETQTVTLDSSGFYNVYLGEVTPLNIEFSYPCWLSVTIGNETLSPRYRLVPTAYSFYSLKASTAVFAQSVNWADVKNKPTGLDNGVGANTIGSYQIIDGTITVSDLASNIDASAKGFNADKVDGLHGSQFIRNDAAEVVTSTHIKNGTITKSDLNFAIYNTIISTSNPYWLLLSTGGSIPIGGIHTHTGLAPAPHAVTHYEGGSDSISAKYVPRNNGVIYSTNTYSGQNTFTKMVTISTSASVSGTLGVTGNVSIGGTLDMTSKKIISLADPTNAQEAATKSYVDSSISGGSGILNLNNTFNGANTFAKLTTANQGIYASSMTVSNAVFVSSYVHANNIQSNNTTLTLKSVNNQVNVAGNLSVNNNLSVSGPCTLGRTLTAGQGINTATMTVAGKSTFSGNVSMLKGIYTVDKSTFNGLVKFSSSTIFNQSVSIISPSTSVWLGGGCYLGIGTLPTPAYSIKAVGEINAGGYSMTAVTRYYTIPATTFIGFTSGMVSISTRGYVTINGAQDINGIAPLCLPNGAIVTNLKAIFSTVQATDKVLVDMYKFDFTGSGVWTNMAEVSFTGATSLTSQNTSTIVSAQIDNTANTYYVHVYMHPATGGNIVRLYGVVVTYTVTNPYP
ncbi:MAG: hypothetical protein LHV68_13125 [Elusimicrobia bacterium]|nr:hypothetical protein [Candidatus Liberimonas magnetica]